MSPKTLVYIDAGGVTFLCVAVSVCLSILSLLFSELSFHSTSNRLALFLPLA